jgi:DNA-binding LacI/PurR family transcriptional regulator
MRSEEGSYAWVAEQLRKAIVSGQVRTGSNLPSTKNIGSQYGVSAETARRAAKQLESEGLLVCQPRHVFRVQARANDPDRGLPIAFVVAAAEEPGLWDEFTQVLFACLQKAALERGWSMLAVGVGGRTGRQVMEQLADCRACGMVLDAGNPALLAEVNRVRLPAVMMDAWDPEMSLDGVVQDSFQGAMVATRYLIGRGHRRIAWLGRISESVQAQERFGGVSAALAAAGVESRTGYMLDTPWQETPRAARTLLAGSDRPDAVLGLWHDAVIQLVRAAAELGLEPGKDVEIVGWTAEEQYGSAYRAGFAGAALPPTVVWSIAELARLAIARLAERRDKPAMPPALIKVPARLKFAEERK